MTIEGKDEETVALERRAAHLRQNLDLLLDEADRRRHAITSAVNVKRQVRMHPGVALGLGGLALGLAIGLPILGVRRARRRRRLSYRAGALGKAVRRMMKRPDRVAETPPHLPKKVLTAALAAAASTLARKQIEQLLTRRRQALAPLGG
jgi:hypothetical protein